MCWLLIHPEAVPGLSPTEVMMRLKVFREEKVKLQAEWGQIPWSRLVDAAVRALRPYLSSLATLATD
jgi:hypothetical protein